MNLRDQLKEVLPEILPSNPAEGIKGTELIRLVKYKLRQEYSDATLRYHFSILCCDPSSPIAKVEQGQGYYLRKARTSQGPDSRQLGPLAVAPGGSDLFQGGKDTVDRELARLNKARALYTRSLLGDARFPFPFTAGFSQEMMWKYPDFGVVDWEIDDSGENGFVLSRDLLKLKQSIAVTPFTLSSVKLALFVTHDNVREVFYQALSCSGWAHCAELVVATAISDEQLADELRRLSAEHGVAVTTLGIQIDQLDELGDPNSIARIDDRAFEALQSRLIARQKISGARISSGLSWRVLNEMRRENHEFASFFGWIEECLERGQAKAWPHGVPLHQS